MKIPRAIPYFKLIVAIVGIYAAVWMILEGALWRDMALAVMILALGAAMLIVRRWGGRTLPPAKGVSLFAAVGLLSGVGVVLLTIFLMALKTGLHAHGPEYTLADIMWIWNQLPVWGGAGGLIGLGAGLLLLARGS
ncbi:MAG: hypothetical protein KBF17_12080 [Candidatus Promineofilum sp.]|nr:hypothetical protein [Promineifilum sp.]MBP9658024.1 hypothetical protein [Promineifilum sp.]